MRICFIIHVHQKLDWLDCYSGPSVLCFLERLDISVEERYCFTPLVASVCELLRQLLTSWKFRSFCYYTVFFLVFYFTCYTYKAPYNKSSRHFRIRQRCWKVSDMPAKLIKFACVWHQLLKYGSECLTGKFEEPNNHWPWNVHWSLEGNRNISSSSPFTVPGSNQNH